MNFMLPAKGSAFGDFIVDDTFLRYWRELVARLRTHRRVNLRTGVPSRFTKVRDPQIVRDAYWASNGNASAASRLLGFRYETILNHVRGNHQGPRYITADECHQALLRHGTWFAARKSLNLSHATFARRINEWKKQQRERKTAHE